MRISDWSSDVCSSDLVDRVLHHDRHATGKLQGPGGLSDDLDAEGRMRCACLHRCRHAHHLVDAGQRRDRDIRQGDQRDTESGITCSRRSEEHTSELQSLMRISYAVFCLKKITTTNIAQ